MTCLPPAAVLLLPLLLACSAGKQDTWVRPGDSLAARAAGIPEVRQRPVFDAPDADAAWLVEQIDGSGWDQGLADAASRLLALHVDRGGRIDAASAAGVAARAGYPGQARFTRALTGGGLPVDVAAEIAAATRGQPVDVGLAVRRFEDGTAMWIVAWARRVARLDPIPMRLDLDAQLPVRVELIDPALAHAELRLFLAPPVGPVEEIPITPSLTRWVDRFHTPGEWRIEVVAQADDRVEVALLFSLWVDSEPERLPPLQAGTPGVENPMDAERVLFGDLNRLRATHGLPPLQWFATFEPLVREHSALMASTGRASHTIEGITAGVAARARTWAYPAAFHHQAVAVAPTAAEAMALVVDSPAHRRTLLCETCTHATVGVALEPVLDRPPRLFVTWELLEFPKGPPVPNDQRGY
ncbi:MAG: CAP domain-containing protein [Alphaproteobacteria bacterium]|nr:CAP domain-containing protein [Alphaproteobacteria bacterium]